MQSREGAKTSVLIVDSIAAVLSPVLGLKNSMQGHSIMVQASLLLKQLSERHKLAAVVTNHLVRGLLSSVLVCLLWRNAHLHSGCRMNHCNVCPVMYYATMEESWPLC